MGKLLLRAAVLYISIQFLPVAAVADRIDDAVALSKRTKCPLLAIGSAEFCGPCRELHHTLETDPQLQPILENCVLLEMDSQTQEFRNFVNRFPADASMIPMVYVVLPDGNPLYAESGGMDGTQLAGLLQEAISYSQPQSPVNETMLASAQSSVPGGLDLDEILKSARDQAQQGNLVSALDLVSPVAAMLGDTEPVVKARGYEQRLESVIGDWMDELGGQLAAEKSMHGAAYRIAELYVELPDHPQLRDQASDLLMKYENEESTRIAVRQAKFLLKARYFENKEDCRTAIDNYNAVVRLDAESPAGDFASQRMSQLQKRQAAKLTAQKH